MYNNSECKFRLNIAYKLQVVLRLLQKISIEKCLLLVDAVFYLVLLFYYKYICT